MLRESEMASSRMGHLTLESDVVRLMIPLHKTDAVGTLTAYRVVAV